MSADQRATPACPVCPRPASGGHPEKPFAGSTASRSATRKRTFTGTPVSTGSEQTRQGRRHPLAGALVCLSFIVWILPLGAFIRPSQEKTACDGRRAFHMCSMMKAPAKQASAGVVIQSASGVQKSAPSPSGSGDDYLVPNKKIVFKNSLGRFNGLFLIVPPNPSLYRLDAVPKI